MDSFLRVVQCDDGCRSRPWPFSLYGYNLCWAAVRWWYIFTRQISHSTWSPESCLSRWPESQCWQIMSAFQRLSSCQQFPHVAYSWGLQSIKQLWEDFQFCFCCRRSLIIIRPRLPRTRWNVPHIYVEWSVYQSTQFNSALLQFGHSMSPPARYWSFVWCRCRGRNRRGHVCGADPAFTPIVIVAFVKSTGSDVPVRFSQAGDGRITIARPYGTRIAPARIPSGFAETMAADKRPGSENDGQAAVAGAERPRPIFQSDAAPPEFRGCRRTWSNPNDDRDFATSFNDVNSTTAPCN